MTSGLGQANGSCCSLPIGSFRLSWGTTPCGFLFKKSGGCGILCGLAQRRFTPGQLGKVGKVGSDLTFLSFNKKWTNWICQVEKEGLGC